MVRARAGNASTLVYLGAVDDAIVLADVDHGVGRDGSHLVACPEQHGGTEQTECVRTMLR